MIMSRRDTILIAVFVNTGVLGLLFLMGVNKEEILERPEEQQIALVANAPIVEIAEAAPIIISKQYDEPPEIEEDNDFDFDSDTLVQKQLEDDSPALPNGFFEVKVKRGDFLERIARANGTTVEEIKKVNHLNSEKLNVGQILRIPNKSGTKPEPVAQAAVPTPKQAPVTPPSSSPKESDAVYYVVKSGDNPWKIAKQFNIRVDQLLKLNNLNETKAKNLKVGDRLRVK
jgi:LysM repeat protein